jgi:hypothetical protein
MMGGVCNPSTQEAEVGGLQVPGQSKLCGEAMSQRRKSANKKNWGSRVAGVHLFIHSFLALGLACV